MTAREIAGNVPLAAALVLAVFLGVSRCQLRGEKRAHASAALRADSAIAEADTTRRSALSERDRAKLLGDSLVVVERRAVQVAQRADALDKALGRERLARADLVARIRSSETRTTSTGGVDERAIAILQTVQGRVSGDTATVRRAAFDVRDEPFTAHADVELPPPPASGTLALRIAIDSAPLSLRLGCGTVDASGIRPATATVSGPVWLAVALGRVEQSPELCRSPALLATKPGVSRTKWAALGLGLGFVAGVVIAKP